MTDQLLAVETPKDPMAVIVDFRRRINQGQEVTDEEIREGIRLLHGYRNKTFVPPKAQQSKAIKTRAKTMTKADAEDLLGDLL